MLSATQNRIGTTGPIFSFASQGGSCPQNSQKATTRVTRRCFCERKCLLDLTFHKSSFT